MASPLSVGDCLAIVNVVIKGCTALSDSSEDAKWLKALRIDLLGLRDVLEQLQGFAYGPNKSPQLREPRQRLATAIERCQDALADLSTVISKYDASSRASRYLKRLRFSLGGKDDILPHQRRLHGCLSSLLVLQQEIGRLTVVDAKDAAHTSAQQLLTSYREGTEEIKLEIYRSIEEPFDHRPIRFQDASGRRYPVPLELCRDFADFMDFLMFSFKSDTAVASMIARKSFWLFTPPMNGGSWWYLINEDDWKTAARSGMKLGMSLYFPRRCNESCPLLCNVVDSTSDKSLSQRRRDELCLWARLRDDCGATELCLSTAPSVRFNTPTPSWNTLPDSLEFRWLSRPATSGPLSMLPTESRDAGLARESVHKSPQFVSCLGSRAAKLHAFAVSGSSVECPVIRAGDTAEATATRTAMPSNNPASTATPAGAGRAFFRRILAASLLLVLQITVLLDLFFFFGFRGLMESLSGMTQAQMATPTPPPGTDVAATLQGYKVKFVGPMWEEREWPEPQTYLMCSPRKWR